MPEPDSPHWTDAYRTDPVRLYEMEAPVFESQALTLQEIDRATALAVEVGAPLASPLLDLACGPGRHARELADRGHSVLGLDLSAGFLSIARRRGAPTAGRVEYVCADLLDLPLPARSFRTGLLLGKGFGYFSDEENQRVLRGAFEALAPGSFFCVELPDRQAYLAGLPEVETVERPLTDGRRVRSRWRSEWRPEGRRLHVDESHVLADSGVLFWEGSWDVRLYDADEIAELLEAVGFDRVRVESEELLEVEGARSEVLFAAAVR